jgi:hydrogenase large subunit
VTEPKFELGPATKGTRTNIEKIDEAAKYSWIKAPRWKGHAMEVGPLARYVMGYAGGHEDIKNQVEGLLRHDEPAGDSALFSTLGRTAARALESEYCGRLQKHFFDKLVEHQERRRKHGERREVGPLDLAEGGQGRGHDRSAARRAGHWVKVKDGRIENYQCVVPTTWNGSPRDSAGNIGAFEASLMDTKMERPEEPVEILRTLHSFDPCLACSTHVMSPDGQELTSVKVR